MWPHARLWEPLRSRLVAAAQRAGLKAQGGTRRLAVAFELRRWAPFPVVGNRREPPLLHGRLEAEPSAVESGAQHRPPADANATLAHSSPLHTWSGTTEYTHPLVLRTAWWAPLLFANAYGVGGLIFALGYRRLGGPPAIRTRSELAFARHFAGRYADPKQPAVKHPAALPDAMVDTLAAQLEKVRWGRKEVEDFLGRWLSEPKSHVFFDPPASPVSPGRFAREAASRGIALSPKTQLLYRRNRYYVNGEPLEVPVSTRSTLRALADKRRLNAEECANFEQKDQEIVEIMYDWYASGWVQISADPGPARKLRAVRKKAG